MSRGFSFFRIESCVLIAGLCCAILHASPVTAAPAKPASTSEINPDELDDGEKSNFRFSTGAYVSAGTIGSKNNTVASRSVSSATGFLQLGHKSGYITPFMRVEYGTSAQSTDSSKVGGTNMGGAGYGIGVGLLVSFGKFGIGGAYMPFGEYDLSAKTVDGNQVKYSEPSVWLVSTGYDFDSLSVFLIQKFTEFSRTTTGDYTTSLGDDKLSHNSFGVGVEWAF